MKLGFSPMTPRQNCGYQNGTQQRHRGRKKSRVVLLKLKVMLFVFFDSKGLVH